MVPLQGHGCYWFSIEGTFCSAAGENVFDGMLRVSCIQ